jgi:VAD1 Analog of StAR-related lipid transfer domain/GRAM domain
MSQPQSETSSGYDHEARNIPFESSSHSHHWGLGDAVSNLQKVARSGGSNSNSPVAGSSTNTASSGGTQSSGMNPSKASSAPSNKSTETIPYVNPSSHSYTTPEAAFAKVEPDQSPASHFLNSIVSAAQNAASSLAALKAEGKNRNRASSYGSSFFGGHEPDFSDTIAATSEDVIMSDVGQKNFEDKPRSFSPVLGVTKAADVVIEPIRHTISTLGKGELSLASLGIDSKKTPSNTPSRTQSTRKGTLPAGTPSSASGLQVPKTAAENVSDSEFDLPEFVHNRKRMETDLASVHTANTSSKRKRLSKHRSDSKNTSTSLGSPNLTNTTNNDEDSSPSESTPSEKNGITGYAYADKKRNKEFHRLFRSVMPDDYLLDDFSCALSREILIQGRLYVSERHVCFNSNILGWVTNLVIGFDEIVTMEKKNTAGLFPNGIVIQTLHARHSFASFVSRDTAMELMTSVWKQTGPYLPRSKTTSTNGTRGYDTERESDDRASVDDLSDSADEDERDLEFSPVEFETSSDEDSDEGFGETARKTKPAVSEGRPAAEKEAVDESADAQVAATSWPVANLGPDTHGATVLPNPDEPGEKVISTETISAPLGVVANLLFGDDANWYKDFLTDVGKNFQLSPIPAFSPDGDKKSRKYDYIKPLHGPIGPKQTKCVCTDVVEKWDMQDGVVVIQSTATPDVPSGGSFLTKTRTGLCWADNNETKIVISFWMEWTAKSWIKGAVEKGAQDGQISTAKDLISALNSSLKASKAKKAAVPTAAKKKPVAVPKKKARKKVQNLEAKRGMEENVGVLQNIANIFSWSPVSVIGIPVWAYLIVFMTLYIFLSSFVWKPISVGQQRELLRLKEEYEMWKWIDDRMGSRDSSGYRSEGISFSSDASLFSTDQKYTTPASFNYRSHNLQDVVEAIQITEHRIKLLKEKLDLEQK